MNYDKAFDFLQNYFFPCVVCTENGRIVYKNIHAEKFLVLPKRGVSIESVMIQDESENDNSMRFRKMKSQNDVFVKALVVPIKSTLDDLYLWIFDISFQFIDLQTENMILSEFGDFIIDLDLENKVKCERRAKTVTFCRFSSMITLALLSSTAMRRSVSVHNASRNLIYTSSDILTKFGCKVSISIDDNASIEKYVDYSTLAFSMIYLLIFSVLVSKTNVISLVSEYNSDFFIYSVGVKCDLGRSVYIKKGGFESIKKLFPDYMFMLEIAERVFQKRNIDMNFSYTDNELITTVFTPTEEKRAKFLHNKVLLPEAEYDFAKISLEYLEKILQVKTTDNGEFIIEFKY